MIAAFLHKTPARATYRWFSRQVIDFKTNIGELCPLEAAIPKVCQSEFVGIV
jgi:hypothetical protein